MKSCLFLFLIFATPTLTLVFSQQGLPKLVEQIKQSNKADEAPLDRNLSLQASEVDLHSLVKKDAKEIKETVERMLFSDEDPMEKADKIDKLNSLLESELLNNMSSQEPQNKERRLQDLQMEDIRNDRNEDQISTSSRMEEVNEQEKAMLDYQQVHRWLDDVKFKMGDLRSNINRRLQDMQTGMQRRSMLMGHYNYMGQSVGLPVGESMNDMDPYAHF